MNAEVKTWAAADGTRARLTTVPGVGLLKALRFVAALDDAKRFENRNRPFDESCAPPLRRGNNTDGWGRHAIVVTGSATQIADAFAALDRGPGSARAARGVGARGR